MVDAIFRVDPHAACVTNGRTKIILHSGLALGIFALTLALSRGERGICRDGSRYFQGNKLVLWEDQT